IASQPVLGNMYKPQLPTVIRPGNTVIRVNYLGIPDYGPPIPFKVEYYYDGVLDESKTEIRKAVAPDYSVDEECFPDKSGAAYQLDPVAPFEPKLPTHPWGGNDVIKVFYVMLPDIAHVAPFTVDYYYDGELDETKTETLNAVAPDFKVNEVDIPDKTEEGYQLDEETPYDPDLPTPVLGSWGSDHVSVFYVSEVAVLPPVDEPTEPVVPPVKGDKKKADKKKNKDKAPPPEPAEETPPPAAPVQAADTPAPAVHVQQLPRTPDTPPLIEDFEEEPGSEAMVPPIDLEPDTTGSGGDGPSMTIMAENQEGAKGPGGGLLLLVLAAVGIAIAAERLIGTLIRRRALLKQ
ncbi:MAG: hypothetical protein FWG03_08200, partial [Clostridiales bacterium]|nr:hypothetical protein [Clostridiales bacterium]